ncbi:MAG: hypothetical protein FWE84_05915 [Firmicutes bacterium]|nr:hypothetical protein [Bacillota bacterium]
MVVLKRKASGETDRYAGYDTVIELEDDRKSFAGSQKVTEEPEVYTKREVFVKPREEMMPSIKKESVAAPAVKQTVSTKAKVLLAAYVIIAVVLAAVVIGTGIALTEIGERNLDTSGKIGEVNTLIDAQSGPLALVRSDEYQIGVAATQYGMEFVNEVVKVQLVPEVVVASYGATGGWFDNLCDWLSNLFK